MIVELAVLVVTLALIYHFFVEFRGHNLPPGPRPWPIIGNLNYLTEDLHLTLLKLEEKYGKIYRLYAGHHLMIVISGEWIKEMYVRKPSEFGGRPQVVMNFYKDPKPNEGPHITLMHYGARWKLYRRLTHSAIKVYSESYLQGVITEEVEELCKRITSQNGKNMDISLEFHKAVTNIICTKIAGQRYEVDDPEFLRIFNCNMGLLSCTLEASLRDVYPILHKILPETKRVETFRSHLHERFAILMEKYQQHKATFDGETIRDYTDALLQTKQEAEKEDHANKEHLEDHIIVSAGMASLFTAGSETISTTLSWAVIYLLHHPEIQERVHQEIIDVIGKEEFPSLNMKKSLPLLDAFTTETQRFSSLVPLLPRETTVDLNLKGYHFPKGTRIFANTWSLLHDPDIWKDPYTFNIDRHLDEAGNYVPPPGGTFFPFGAGARVCPGEVLARSELYLFLCRLLQQFKFENPPGSELPSLVGDNGMVLHNKHYLARVIKRF